MKNITLALVAILSVFMFNVQAQRGQYNQKTSKKQFYGNQRLNEPLFKWVTGDHQRHGIQLSFGPTYTFTRINPREHTAIYNDTVFNYSHDPKGNLGLFAEVGMVHITKRPRKYIQYYDWGVGYKQFSGREYTQAHVLDDRDSIIASMEGQGKFTNGHLFGRFSVHNVFQINPRTFLDNALGVNLDYSFMGRNTAYDGFHLPQTQLFQGEIMGQLHYDVGFGFKPRNGFFVIPGVQLPILTAYEWNEGHPSIHWFSSKYYPVQFKLKLVWLLKKDPNRCPPVETNEEDRKRAKEFMNR